MGQAGPTGLVCGLLQRPPSALLSCVHTSPSNGVCSSRARLVSLIVATTAPSPEPDTQQALHTLEGRLCQYTSPHSERTNRAGGQLSAEPCFLKGVADLQWMNSDFQTRLGQHGASEPGPRQSVRCLCLPPWAGGTQPFSGRQGTDTDLRARGQGGRSLRNAPAHCSVRCWVTEVWGALGRGRAFLRAATYLPIRLGAFQYLRHIN